MSECTCKVCPTCGGTGNAWVAFDGTYLGGSRCDDLDELITCPDCEGTGVADAIFCDHCEERFREAEEAEAEEYFRETHRRTPW